MIRTALPLLCLPLPALADVNVVTDIAPIHSLTAQIMGDVGTPAMILPADGDPHDFAFRPSDAQALQDAELVIMVGPTLTPWLAEPVEALAGSAAHLVLVETEGWTPLEMRSEHDHGHGNHDDHGHDDHGDEAHDDHGHDDHDDHADEEHDDHAHDDHDDQGDEKHDEHAHDDHDDHSDEKHDDHDHAEEAHDDHNDHGHDDHADKASVDPHGWMDPTIASVWAASIAEALTEADPDNAATYAANLATTQSALAELDAKYATQLADAGALLWPHDGYQYLEARYGLDAKGSIADVHAATPGPGRVQALIDLMTSEQISCIMTDREINGDWVEVVRADSEAGTAFIDGVGGGFAPGPELYQSMMDALVTSIADC